MGRIPGRQSGEVEAEMRHQGGPGDAAGAQQARCSAEARHHGGLDPDQAPPAIDQRGNPAVEISQHVAGIGRAHAPGAICRRRGDGATDGPEEIAGDGVRRHPQGDARQPGAGEIADPAGGRGRNDQGQGAGPERLGEASGIGVEDPLGKGCVEIGQVRDQGIEARALLGGVDPRHRRRIAGIGTEPVDGLGGEGDEPARAQDRGGLGNARGIVAKATGRLGRGIGADRAFGDRAFGD